MFTHSDTFEGEVSVLAGDGNEAEVGSAPADIADKQEIAGLDLFAPVGALVFKPGIKSGLGLLEEGGFRDSGELGGFERESASDFVE